MDTPKTVASPALVEVDWLYDHLHHPDVCLIEVDRVGLDHYDRNHIPGAIGWNWKQALWDPAMREFPAPQDMARRLSETGVTPQTRLVVYGEPVQFGVYAWWVLKYCGHENTVLLNGGHRAWVARGHELTDRKPKPRPPTEYPVPHRRDEMRASREAVLQSLERADTRILDARTLDEYQGRALGSPDANHGAERYGRIPGAVHVYFGDLLDQNERFRDADELRARLEREGVTPDKRLISYCRLSHRASVAYFAMTQLLGYPDVRLYDGSWTEWGSMVGMPIEVPTD